MNGENTRRFTARSLGRRDIAVMEKLERPILSTADFLWRISHGI